MRKTMILVALVATLPAVATAQVDKRVEVTKAYVPNIESAQKLTIAPDMTDTTRMRPEIDYSITPLSLQRALSTRPIQPAKVTYWEFNRPTPFYLKVGAGYPLNSVVDFYASTQNPGTGYVVGYVNHEGRYAKIGNDFGVKNPSTQLLNRIGVAAGKYFGRRTLEGDISYENRLYHRYGAFVGTAPEEQFRSTYMPGSRVDFGDAKASFRFGDDFKDLTRTNFEVAVSGALFSSYPEVYGWEAEGTQIKQHALDANARQWSLGARAKVARGFGHHRLAIEAGYEWLDGQKVLDAYGQQQIYGGLRYGYEGEVVAFELGADYYHDAVEGGKAKSYVIPFARVDVNLGAEGLKPFFEFDGGVYENSYRSLTRQNPYYTYEGWGDKSSVDYNGRFGVAGSLWRSRFSYRLYAAFSIHDNRPYWSLHSAFGGMLVNVIQSYDFGRQTVTSFNGEAEWRPISPLLVSLAAHGYLYNDDVKLENGAPAFDGRIGVSYQARKFSVGVSALLQTERSWSVAESSGDFSGDEQVTYGRFTAPFAADLRVDVDWRISRSITLFAQGRNLANRKLYQFAMYPQYGANFTLGIKANF